MQICPLNGNIKCHAAIKIGALSKSDPYGKPEHFSANFQFSWKIEGDEFDDIASSKEPTKLLPSNLVPDNVIPAYDIPRCNDVLVMELNYSVPKSVLRDYNNYYEICLDGYSSDDD